jgi:hypothetical protein
MRDHLIILPPAGTSSHRRADPLGDPLDHPDWTRLLLVLALAVARPWVALTRLGKKPRRKRQRDAVAWSCPQTRSPLRIR